MTKCLILARPVWEKIRAQAIAEWPHECLGMLVGLADGWVRDAYPIVNASTDPHRFLSDPESLLAAEKRRRQEGWHLLGFYHSHPGGQPIPSTLDTDPEINFWLDGSVVSMIVALRPASQAVAAHLPPADNTTIPETASSEMAQLVTESLTTKDSPLPTCRDITKPASAEQNFSDKSPPNRVGWAIIDTFRGYRLEARIYCLYPGRWEPLAVVLER